MKKIQDLRTKDFYELAADVTVSSAQEIIQLATGARNNDESEVIVEMAEQEYIVIFPGEKTLGKIILG